jgi:hypothetical protein
LLCIFVTSARLFSSRSVASIAKKLRRGMYLRTKVLIITLVGARLETVESSKVEEVVIVGKQLHYTSLILRTLDLLLKAQSFVATMLSIGFKKLRLVIVL